MIDLFSFPEIPSCNGGAARRFAKQVLLGPRRGPWQRRCVTSGPRTNAHNRTATTCGPLGRLHRASEVFDPQSTMQCKVFTSSPSSVVSSSSSVSSPSTPPHNMPRPGKAFFKIFQPILAKRAPRR
jgi:hypothetical protein